MRLDDEEVAPMGKWLLAGALVLGALLDLGTLYVVFGGGHVPGVSYQTVEDHPSAYVYTVTFVPMIVWVLIYVTVTVFALVDAVLRVRRLDLPGLWRATVLVKLAGIPYFVLNFVALTFVVIGTTALLGVGIFFAPILITCTYLVMLPTSIYGFACLAALGRRRAASRAYITVHVLLHLVFVVDIISTLVVARRAARVPADQPGSAPVDPTASPAIAVPHPGADRHPR